MRHDAIRTQGVGPINGSGTSPGPTDLKERFPGVVTWYGVFTGSWWAYLPIGSGRLIEAVCPEDLTNTLSGLWDIQPWPR